MKPRTNIIYSLFALFALACFVLPATAWATCQQGCDITRGSTFLGDNALVNSEGSSNTAIGDLALSNNTTGTNNTATGAHSLQNNSIGFQNTATGNYALEANTTGSFNTATGENALAQNITGNNNTVQGFSALSGNIIGHDDTAVGFVALGNATGSFNIALGASAGINLTTGNNNIDIGSPGHAGESSTIRIGRQELQTATFIAGISGATVPTGVAVIVDSSGHLGTATSSAGFKDEIKPMDKASEAILALKPVTFRYKHELDPKGIPQFGLVAEEVKKVNPDLVARDEQGKPFTVRYEAVNAMLLNEFLKEHKKTEKLEATVASLIATVKEQAAQIQKVSAQLAVANPSHGELEASKRASQTVVLNNW
jgi:hypothetical protein